MVLEKHALGMHTGELTMASGFVGTSLGILLSQVCVTAHVRESKVVHTLLSATGLIGQSWGRKS